MCSWRLSFLKQIHLGFSHTHFCLTEYVPLSETEQVSWASLGLRVESEAPSSPWGSPPQWGGGRSWKCREIPRARAAKPGDLAGR